MAKILVVEDQTVQAMALEGTLRDAGHDVICCAATVDDALKLLAGRTPDVALLDVRLRDEETVYPAAYALEARGIPFAFITAVRAGSLPAAFRKRPLLTKPVDPRDALSIVNRLLKRPAAPRDVKATLPDYGRVIAEGSGSSS